MKYALSIDWLSVFCLYVGSDDWHPVDSGRFSYHVESFGTRCFSRFCRVRMANVEGGWDDFAEIQWAPYSSVLPPYAMIVRFVNRSLYLPDFWELADAMLCANEISCQSISRIDICADFNDFASISPKALIEGFAAKKLRHIGRGVGALYFNHGRGAERDEFDKPIHDYGVSYTGLSFGKHSSDAHVYLYNKTLELDTQGDKPWIREIWSRAGLDVRHVWRLEVSIKSQGLRFKDKASGDEILIDAEKVSATDELDKIYHTFIKKLFSFVKNRRGITNISREPRLVLFDSAPAYDRGAIKNLSPGNRMEKILIKTLYQFADRYRVLNIYNAEEHALRLADSLAHATGLDDWFAHKMNEWEKPIHK